MTEEIPGQMTIEDCIEDAEKDEDE